MVVWSHKTVDKVLLVYICVILKGLSYFQSISCLCTANANAWNLMTEMKSNRMHWLYSLTNTLSRVSLGAESLQLLTSPRQNFCFSDELMMLCCVLCSGNSLDSSPNYTIHASKSKVRKSFEGLIRRLSGGRDSQVCLWLQGCIVAR